MKTFFRILLTVVFSLLLAAALLAAVIFCVEWATHDPAIKSRTVANISAFLSMFAFVALLSLSVIAAVKRRGQPLHPSRRPYSGQPFEIALDGRVALRDYRRARREGAVRRRTRWRITAVLFALFCGFAAMAGSEKHGDNYDLPATALLLAAGILAAGALTGGLRRSRREWRLGRHGEATALRITDEGVTIAEGGTRREMAWSRFDGTDETRRYIRLHYEVTAAIWVDKRRIDPAHIDLLRAFLASITTTEYSFYKNKN